MPRVQLELPSEFIFSTEVSVRISDINYGGHLSNDAVLSIAHEARLRFLQYLGFTELDLGGASVIMADTAIVYKGEGFYGDIIEIKVTAGDFTSSGFDIYYHFTNKKSGREIAKVKTGMVCFDYAERKIKPVPEKFKNKIDSLINKI